MPRVDLSILMITASLLLPAALAFGAPDVLQAKPASAATIEVQERRRASLPPDTGQDAEFVRRGFIATRKDPLIRDANGRVIWDLGLFDWVDGDAPATVSPGLWRQMKLLRVHGLFSVTDGVWQVRGFDASNMTIVNGKTGWTP